jgi:hypothetical protein
VLSGGIGGWVHRFFPGGPCYGCVASHLQRTVTEEPTGKMPDYSNAGAAEAETTVPATKASIEAIASLHALITLEVISNHERSTTPDPRNEVNQKAGTPREPFTSMLFTLQTVPGVFEEAFRTYRFTIPRAPGCLVCSTNPIIPITESGENLDVALDQALDRLAPQ